MRGKLYALWDRLRSSYWFIPTLMTLLALGLSLGFVALDDAIGQDWARGIDFLHANKPEGARALLQTVAGSMIGVAGVTFSITIASVVYASGQYGPRLLTNFMRDTGNQITLGTFIATFIYCVMVLRAVHAAEEGSANAVAAVASAASEQGDLAGGTFVPHVAILAAVLLALASIAVLIYFIHHIPQSIHVSNVVAGIGRELERRVERVFPERIGQGSDADGAADADPDADDGHGADVAMPDDFYTQARPVRSDVTGYLQGIDGDSLIDAAKARSVVLRLRFRPGDFVRAGDTLALAHPGEKVDDDLTEDVRYAFNWGTQRTALQDLRFLVNELVEIAARALSPGVNDPFTAMSCLDWLGAAVARLGGRGTPDSFRRDDEGAIRVIARPTRFEEFVEAAFGQLRPYVAADRNALFHELETLAAIAPHLQEERQRQAIRDEADALIGAARQNELGAADLEEAGHRYDVLMKLLGGELSFEETAAESSWLGGSA
ncbi:MAG: DUF2254 domain-containing protein [Deltaproteobacteria bacterium]|nr:DUF2254 domain-containing protein [Deltaproteobacteria bacterium]